MVRRRRTTYEEQLQDAADDYAQEVEDTMACFRRELLIPFCRKQGWTFNAGMGVWSFYGPKGDPIDHEVIDAMAEVRSPRGRLAKQVLDVLTFEGASGQTVGSEYAQAVTEEDIKEAGDEQ